MSKVLKKEETEQKQRKRSKEKETGVKKMMKKRNFSLKIKFKDVFNNFINTFLFLETGRKKISLKVCFKMYFLITLLTLYLFLVILIINKINVQ